ncbi:MAG: hypothetical protein HKO57_02460 [Akkermansiaceae bacterium]|nr:hypothetical protein [Akkermansiaceae bacterium]
MGSTGTRDARSNDPADYNAYVTAEAAAAGLTGASWKAMVSVNLDGGTTQALSARMNVKDNTGTADLTGGSGVGGAGFPVYAMDGTTCIARNNADIWNGWSNPFDGDSAVRVAPPASSQNVHYSPFLDQFGNQTVTPDNIHGIDVATGAGSNGNHVNALGDTTDDTTISRGNANANSVGRVWNRFTNNTSDTLSYYALSDPLTVVAGTDTTAPAVTSFEDDKAGGPVLVGETVTYTVTFSEPMNAATVGTADFANASATAITVDSVGATADPAVFEVAVTPDAAGTLQLRVAAGATLEDPSGNSLDPGSASPDNTIITVNADTTPPAVNSFVDDAGGGPIFAGDSVTYTVTFSEGMNSATVNPADFGNAASAPITVDSVNPTGDPAVFQVAVTATGPGSLRLRVAPSATLEDPAGNPLDAGAASPDDTIITVEAPPALVGELGILDLTANGGINPNTGNPWQAGDQYRLAFVSRDGVTATSNDPAVYNAFATSQAAAAGLGGNWVALVTVNLDSSMTQAASPKSDPRVQSGTDDQSGGAGIGGAGVPVFAMDGATCIARNNADIWNTWSNPFDGDAVIRIPAGTGAATQNVHYSPFLDQFGGGDSGNVHGANVWTGSNTNGTPVNPLGDTTDEVRANWGSSNANNTSRVWNRFQSDNTASLSVYALSDPLTVMSGGGDYAAWAALYPGADLTDPNADLDGDGLTNNEERIWGLDPEAGASSSPINTPLDPAGGTFIYTRRDPSLSGLTYTVWTSTTLQPGSWVRDTGAGQAPGAPDANDIESVVVTLSPGLLTGPILFVRVEAAE